MTRSDDSSSELPTSVAEGVAAIGVIFALTVSALGQAIALAALIFAGPLSSGLPRATSNFMLAAAMGIVFIGWRSKLVPSMSTSQDGPAVVMVATATTVTASGSLSPATDVLVIVGVVTFTSAVLMMAIARFGLGGIVRYIPTTVVSGFVAGTGWLLSKGGFDVMTNGNLGLGDVGALFGIQQLKFWVPGAVLALAILGLGRIPAVPRLVPSCLPVVSILLFYLVVAGLSSMSAIEDDGWLIGPFQSGAGVQLLSPNEVVDADWGWVLAELPGLLGVVLITLVALLLNLTGLEAMRRERVDVDHETTTASIANFLIAPLGGNVGFQALGANALASELGAKSRLIPVGTGLVAAAFALTGSYAVGFVPRLVVGGLLLTVGLTLLLEWTSELLRTTSHARRVFGLGIVATIAFVGILEGIAVGILVAVAIFVYEYSQIDPVRLAGNGNQFRSRVDRLSDDAAMLDQQRDRLEVHRLQGYLFFGSMNQLADRIRERCGNPDLPLQAVVIDFRYVTGIDWSAYSLLAQLGEEIESVGASVHLCGLRSDLFEALQRSEPAFVARSSIQQTLDETLEEAETLLLASALLDPSKQPKRRRPELSAELVKKFVSEAVEAGTVVLTQGDESFSLHLVRSGDFSAFRTDESGQRQRLRRFGPGTTIGEIGLVTGAARSADVIADTDAEVLTMSRKVYQELRSSSPDLALELQDYLLQTQADRVVTLSAHLSQALR